MRIAGGQFRVNGGAWETAMRTVSTGDLVEVQVTSSPNYNDQSVATINIGGEVQRFEVNTMASAPTVTTEVPADFPFTPVT